MQTRTRMIHRVLAVAVLLSAVAGREACSGETCGEPDVWVASTRHLGGTCHTPTESPLAIERLAAPDNGCRRWERSDLASLLGEPHKPLLIFIHGNRYDSASAKQQGVLLARRLAACCPHSPPVRTVIFSWPSQKQGCLLGDGRTKYRRCYTDAHYLASLVGRIEPTRPLAILGYSFGALITLEALEDLCDAQRHGMLRGMHSCRHRPGGTRVVLVAAAVRCDALAPRGPYRQAMECFDTLTLINNSRDDALRFFPLLDRSLDLPALGYVGMPRRWVPPEIEYRAFDAAGIVGREHGLPLYLESNTLSRRIAEGTVGCLPEGPLAASQSGGTPGRG